MQIATKRAGLRNLHYEFAAAIAETMELPPERAWHRKGWLSYGQEETKTQNCVMLYYTLVFLLIALLAGALGFFAVAGIAATIAKVLFVIFLVLFIVSLLRGRKV